MKKVGYVVIGLSAIWGMIVLLMGLGIIKINLLSLAFGGTQTSSTVIVQFVISAIIPLIMYGLSFNLAQNEEQPVIMYTSVVLATLYMVSSIFASLKITIFELLLILIQKFVAAFILELLLYATPTQSDVQGKYRRVFEILILISGIFIINISELSKMKSIVSIICVIAIFMGLVLNPIIGYMTSGAGITTSKKKKMPNYVPREPGDGINLQPPLSADEIQPSTPINQISINQQPSQPMVQPMNLSNMQQNVIEQNVQPIIQQEIAPVQSNTQPISSMPEPIVEQVPQQQEPIQNQTNSNSQQSIDIQNVPPSLAVLFETDEQ